MSGLQRLIASLQDKAMFIVARRSDKAPVDPQTRTPIDAHDPANWMLPVLAQQWVARLGSDYVLGIVLHAGCGIACVDLDGALTAQNTWNSSAMAICARFPGAYREVSMSGKGLHIFVRYTGVIEHGTKNLDAHAELYTVLRYIALTGDQADGDLIDCTEQLKAFATEYFPPKANSVVEWTDKATNPAWAGPEDDATLIELAKRSRSAAAVFGSKASFTDLWENRTDVLAKCWPGENGGVDESHADAALAAHLAWWTGCNAERIRRLMRQSALARSKWDREDYLPRTITKACAITTGCYVSGARATSVAPAVVAGIVAAHAQSQATQASAGVGAVAGVPPVPAGPPAAMPATGLVMLPEQLVRFKGCMYIQDMHAIAVPGIEEPLDQKRFDVHFAGEYQMTIDGQRPTRSAWECFTESGIHTFPRVRGTYFEPRDPAGTIKDVNGQSFVNTYVPLNLPDVEGDPSPFVAHVYTMLPHGNDAEILISYLAACVQYPGVKSMWAPLIQGTPGNGKSRISEAVSEAIGLRYTHTVRASLIDARFNAHLHGKVLLTVNDVKVTEGKAGVWETLKTLITDRRQEIEYKGGAVVTRDLCANFIFSTNHKDAIAKTADDRRICPLFCAQQSPEDMVRDGLLGVNGQNTAAFHRLMQWLSTAEGVGVVRAFLRSYPIPDRYNFATHCTRAPVTSATSAAIEAGRGPAEQEILNAVAEGTEGFRGGWISSHAVNALLDRSGKGRFVPHNKRREMLSALGYLPHPGLGLNQQTSAPLWPGGPRPVLYVTKNHPSSAAKGNGIVQEYKAAQDALGR